MSTAPAFELAAELLERDTSFDRLAARGTLRLALREAGLDPRSVTPAQMIETTRSLLPRELECRGVADAAAVCAALVARLARVGPDDSPLAEKERSLFSTESLGKPR